MTDLCPTCHETHKPLPALGFIAPDPYAELSAAERAQFSKPSAMIIFASSAIPTKPTALSAWCWTFRLFIDHDETLDYGVWVSVSETSFNDYRAHFDGDHEATYFGMICNRIMGYEPSTMFLHCNVYTQPNGRRPFIKPHQSEHPLIRDYTHGISYQEAKARVDAAFNGFSAAEAR